MPMPTRPVYSDRISFMFTVYHKDIPVRRDFRIPSGIRSRLNSFMRTVTRADPVESNYNVGASAAANTKPPRLARLSEMISYQVKMNHFFKILGDAFEAGLTENKICSIWNWIHRISSGINSEMQGMEGVLVEKYGIVHPELQIKNVQEFLEILEVAHKFMGPEFKPITKRIPELKERFREMGFRLQVENKKPKPNSAPRRKRFTLYQRLRWIFMF